MKQRFRARELWLFAPFLLIGVAALYWARIEKVSGPSGRGMHVSDFQLTDAPGYWREKGYSHQIKVKIAHLWPRPKWWGQTGNIRSQSDPLHPETPQSLMKGTTPDQYMAPGTALTIKQAGKDVRWGKRGSQGPIDSRFEENEYRFQHLLKLSELPRDKTPVTFHGLYRIVGQPQIALKREILKAGQSLPMSPEKNTSAQLMQIDSAPFVNVTNSSSAGKTTLKDAVWVQFRVRDLQSPASDPTKSPLLIYDVEIEDEKGQIIKPYETKGFTQGVIMSDRADREPRSDNERRTGAGLDFDQSLKTTGRLIMRGKLSLNWQWPIEFEVKLPPREKPNKSFSETDPYVIPLWRDGKPIETR